MLSVIVPIYNMELYLEKCIESIIGQTYKKLEIIIVDDGSTDSSLAICNRYASKDKRIKVIHKENGGRVSARKVGVLAASFDYIAYVDADDWLEPDMYEELMKCMLENNCDAIITGYIREENIGAKNVIPPKDAGVYENGSLVHGIYNDMIYNIDRMNVGVNPSLCNKLWRKDIILMHQMETDDDIFYGEDMAVTYPSLLDSKKVAVINSCKYHYRIREESETHSIPDTFFESIGKIYKYLKRKLAKCEYKDITLPQLDGYMNFLINMGMNGLLHIEKTSGKIFLFPYETVEKDLNIVIYGAGEVGTSYIKQLEKNRYCNVVLWVDARYEALREKGMDVYSPEQISNCEYDYIIIALENPNIVKSITDTLIQAGINSDKIMWKEPVVLKC